MEEGNNRIIVATDGDFNVGLSSDDDMVRLIEKERKRGIFLTILGFGTGNLKDSKLEKIGTELQSLMEETSVTSVERQLALLEENIGRLNQEIDLFFVQAY